MGFSQLDFLVAVTKLAFELDSDDAASTEPAVSAMAARMTDAARPNCAGYRHTDGQSLDHLSKSKKKKKKQEKAVIGEIKVSVLGDPGKRGGLGGGIWRPPEYANNLSISCVNAETGVRAVFGDGAELEKTARGELIEKKGLRRRKRKGTGGSEGWLESTMPKLERYVEVPEEC